MIKPAQIQWTDGTPVSTQFDDVYFSKASGLEEAHYVFLQHNHLPERWQSFFSNEFNHTVSQHHDHFSIAETGFGTGLNFLCAWKLWQQTAKSITSLNTKSKTLHFVSVEKFPLEKTSLEQALQQWPELNEYSQALLEVYPALVPGWHTINLPKTSDDDPNVILHLFFGDIHDWLPEIHGKIDAWFLDGFAPSKNPDMWNDNLFLQMARLTPAFGTVATFTASGIVKRGLIAAGFAIIKVKGFGKKRDMLTAEQLFTNGPQPPAYISQKPWFTHKPFANHIQQNNKQAVVIGAGIAGCTTAYSLAQRGWKVTLLDAQDSVAQGASGNAQGVLYAKLSSQMNLQSQFYLAGYLRSLDLLNEVLKDKSNWDDCGVLQLAFNEKEQDRQKSFCERFQLDDVVIPVDAKHASNLANCPIEQSGLYFKHGAWVYPSALCEALIRHENIEFLPNQRVTSLEVNTDKCIKWTVKTGSQAFTADTVIVCNASQAKHLSQLNFLPTKNIAGQVSQVPQSNDIKLDTVLCGESYVTPTHNNALNFGASYRLNSESTESQNADHEENLNKLSDNFPSVFNQLNAEQRTMGNLKGRTSVRCTSPDYTPIVGPVCVEDDFLKDFAALKKNRKWRFYQDGKFHDGLFVNVAHGSRGLSSAPLCAELIAAMIEGEPWPMPEHQALMLHPSRFLVKLACAK